MDEIPVVFTFAVILALLDKLLLIQHIHDCMATFLLPVFSFKGLRDDLTCLLDEDLSSLCLCALHCEMRNTEQILKSVGLLAFEIGSLQECNDELSKYGPENFKADRITVKLRPGQQTAPGRNNISFASCSGQLHSITHNHLWKMYFHLEQALP